jgi:hypothetical protein
VDNIRTLLKSLDRVTVCHHGRIADRLARAGLPVYAQHVDPIDTGTLVDIFRDDPHASLIGTDALRDGVDVPGHSLRCVGRASYRLPTLRIQFLRSCGAPHFPLGGTTAGSL